VDDRRHTPHRLQTTLTPAQEAVAVALRKTLLVSLDDLLAVVRVFLNPNASRSGLDHSPLSLGPCVDGSRGARAFFGSGIWSVAAMCTASDLQHCGCAP